MQWTVGIAAVFLAGFFILTLAELGIMIFAPTTKWGINFSTLTDQKEHLMMFALSLLSAYSLLTPYLLLKSILTRNDKMDTPLTETSKEGFELVSKNNN